MSGAEPTTRQNNTTCGSAGGDVRSTPLTTSRTVCCTRRPRTRGCRQPVCSCRLSLVHLCRRGGVCRQPPPLYLAGQRVWAVRQQDGRLSRSAYALSVRGRTHPRKDRSQGGDTTVSSAVELLCAWSHLPRPLLRTHRSQCVFSLFCRCDTQARL